MIAILVMTICFIPAKMQERDFTRFPWQNDDFRRNSYTRSPYKQPEPVNTGTISSKRNLNASEDAIKLHQYMKGFGTNEQGVIDVLTQRSNEDRQKIASVFHNMYDKDLAYKIQREFSFHAREALKDLLIPTADYDAQILMSSMKGAGTDLDSVTSVLCSKSSDQIQKIKASYQKQYKKNLEDVIRSETTDPVLSLYLSLINNEREKDANPYSVEKDVEDLVQTNFKDFKPDNALFKILSTRSRDHIKMVLGGYKQKVGAPLSQALDQDLSGAITKQGKAVRTIKILECYTSPPKFYAQQILNAVKGVGTNDRKMFRILIARSEIDLQKIMEEFQRLASVDLKTTINKETSGTFKKVLLGILEGNKDLQNYAKLLKFL